MSKASDAKAILGLLGKGREFFAGKPKIATDAVDAVSRIAKRKETLGLGAYNPLVSLKEQRMTVPRSVLGLGTLGIAGLTAGALAGSEPTTGVVDLSAIKSPTAGQYDLTKAQEAVYSAIPYDTQSYNEYSKQLQQLANAGAEAYNTAAGAGTAGTGAAQAATDYYGGAAQQAADIAMADTGSGQSGLVPVSGSAAAAPAELTAAGSALSDYLKATEGIQSGMLGATKESTARQSVGLQQQLAQALQGYQLRDVQAVNEARRNALADIALQNYKNQAALGAQPYTPVTEASLAPYVAEWNAFTDADKKRLSKEGIKTPTDYVNRRLGNA